MAGIILEDLERMRHQLEERMTMIDSRHRRARRDVIRRYDAWINVVSACEDMIGFDSGITLGRWSITDLRGTEILRLSILIDMLKKNAVGPLWTRHGSIMAANEEDAVQIRIAMEQLDAKTTSP